ncbi:phosphopantetheine-binding protein [Streptomyces sp. MB09-01]|uniref:phosphopantetheine-binding protein n=2 Tax=unclassified Streptomyces TaxID=2593676 RepID=UPI0029A21A53|nr:phosphopantetheine-binding protein [Streptomyces sp. MB09-01]MDX3535554.1 phosphopantetheine-binding protein [Streptomyces sp. MB09-01]
MTQRTEEDMRRQIRDIVISMAPDAGAADGTDPDLVETLGYHSLALLELAFALEDEYALPPIDQESAQSIRTVSDVENYVLAQLRQGEGDGGAR